MTSPFLPGRLLTVQEYLELEDKSEQRHEYVDGEVFPIASTTYRHNQIVLNIVTRLRSAAKGGPCTVSMEMIRLRIGKTRFYYPDVMTVCGAVDMSADVATSPCCIIEVSSPSTSRFDRSEKLAAYQSLESLKVYLIVEQGWRRVTRHWRDADSLWQREDLTGDGFIPIPCPEMTLGLAHIYDGLAPLSVKELEAIGYPAPIGA
jgi:Uma2 family endonuclease